MTARPAHSGTPTDRVPRHGGAPDAVAADPDLALARWENEGGVPARLHIQDDTLAAPAVTERSDRFPGSIITDDAAGR